MHSCDACNTNVATVHIFDLDVPPPGAPPDTQVAVRQQHLCQACAQMMNLPQQPTFHKKSVVDIWKLLQQSARQSRKGSAKACPECGLSLDDFRRKGRLGCPRCYETFDEHLRPLLQRMHNAIAHVGRVPGVDEAELERMQHISELRQRLEEAIREEEYEDAAKLRDELTALEAREA